MSLPNGSSVMSVLCGDDKAHAALRHPIEDCPASQRLRKKGYKKTVNVETPGWLIYNDKSINDPVDSPSQEHKIGTTFTIELIRRDGLPASKPVTSSATTES